MPIRLAIVGASLVIMGLLNLGGYGTITIVIGACTLLAAAITWAVTRRRPDSSTRG
jgi:hypothetical protein